MKKKEEKKIFFILKIKEKNKDEKIEEEINLKAQ